MRGGQAFCGVECAGERAAEGSNTSMSDMACLKNSNGDYCALLIANASTQADDPEEIDLFVPETLDASLPAHHSS